MSLPGAALSADVARLRSIQTQLSQDTQARDMELKRQQIAMDSAKQVVAQILAIQDPNLRLAAILNASIRSYLRNW